MMKRIGLLMLMAVMTMAVYGAKAKTVYMGGVIYKIEGGRAIISGALENATDITIEGYVEYKGQKYEVTWIERDNTNGAVLRQSFCPSLRRVTFSNTCTKIIPFVLHYSSVETVVIPNTVQTIGEYAFENCKSLHEIVIPQSVKSIERGVFSGCKYLRDIILPDDVMFGERVFGYIYDEYNDYYCNNLTNVKYHSGKVATDLLDVLPPNCPFVKSGGKLRNPNFDKPLLAKYKGENVTMQPIVATVPMAPVTTSDVDENIPKTASSNASTFAVIIGNEDYKDAPKVVYATHDAQVFAEYCRQTLGIPQQNISVYTNASYGEMLKAVKYVKDVVRAHQGRVKVVFYYSGHGIPDEKTYDAYLLPTDADGTMTETCYSVNRLYSDLGSCGAQSTVVFLDACFSGANREGGVLQASARGVAIKAKPASPVGKMVVMSAATGDETAYPYKEKAHGLFTYYLLKKLQATKGSCTLGELADYVTEEVGKTAIVTNKKGQTPMVSSSPAMDWRTMKLR